MTADNGPIHRFFGITQANHLVLPRAVLQSMPRAWQARFVDLLHELGDAADRVELQLPDYEVRAVDPITRRFIADPIPHYRRAPNLLVARVEAEAEDADHR
jgi:hypothetical protein